MAKAASPSHTQAPAVHCRVEVASAHAHLFQVTLTITAPAARQSLALPAWIPGSYLVREFAKHLQHISARQGTRRVALEQIDKCTWVTDANPVKPLVVSYQVYALDNSVRTAWLDAARGFFNSTSLCLRAEGRTHLPHTLELVAPKALPAWKVATGLAPLSVNAQGFGTYLAADYDELADCPVELGDFWRGHFVACGVPHEFVVAGAAASLDHARLLADTQRICETEIRFWHGNKKPPYTRYLFMLNVVDDGYGGLEHRNSTALIAARRNLPRLSGGPLQGPKVRQPEGYTTLLGLISHEYFHTWNVKRLRPAEFASYDYSRENYTGLLWFFEGFTSYYDDLLLRRAGLVDDAGYLKLLTKTLNQVLQAPGRQVQSVAQASFDAWVKYYRQDENTPNATISYYTKGALVALCLDLTLRREGKSTLDAVMRGLWLRCKGGPMREADLADELLAQTGRSFASELAQWVHSTDELPVQQVLEHFGVQALEEPAQIAQALGLRVTETSGIQVKSVLRGSAAERAGFASGDEWLAVEVDTDVGMPVAKGRQAGKATAAAGKARHSATWRVQKLEDLPLHLGTATHCTALVARDKRVLHLSLALPEAATTLRLTVRDVAKATRWLAS